MRPVMMHVCCRDSLSLEVGLSNVCRWDGHVDQVPWRGLWHLDSVCGCLNMSLGLPFATLLAALLERKGSQLDYL
jgi:hypothetical protein